MTTTTTETFRALLKAHRESRRWSQERLAAEADYDHSTLSRLENGSRNATRANTLALALALGLADDDTDALLIAAGFAPTRRSSMVADEPSVVQVYMLLHDETIAAPVKEAVRQQLAGLVAVAANTTRVKPWQGPE